MTMLQIRNVPEEMHRQLKARAALAGQSLSEYALAELRKSLDKPTRAEVLARIAARPPTPDIGESVVDAIHAERAARDAVLEERTRR